MAASYDSDWPVLPGTEPRPITSVQWPTPLRIELSRTPEVTAQLSAQLPNSIVSAMTPAMPMSLPL